MKIKMPNIVNAIQMLYPLLMTMYYSNIYSYTCA